VTKHLQFATEMMGADAGFHANQAPRHVGQSRFHLAARPLLTQNDRSPFVQAYNVERVLANINAYYGDRAIEFLGHDVLHRMAAPRQHASLMGQERGRTIPLAEVTPSPGAPHMLFDASGSLNSGEDD